MECARDSQVDVIDYAIEIVCLNGKKWSRVPANFADAAL